MFSSTKNPFQKSIHPIALLLLLLITFLISGCANMFNGLVLPNQCKKCVVKHINTGEIVHTEEGCGSANTRLEENAKVYAYNLNAQSNQREYTVECETWKEKE